jgi:HSP20 family protein
MNALTRFERMDELFPEFFRRFTRPMAGTFESAPPEIRLDVTEREKDYVVRAEVPGAKKEDVRVQIDGNYVSISADVRKEKETKDDDGRVLLKESSHGTATRGFSLAYEVDDKASSAKLDNGVLTLTLPKRQGAGSRLLSIE